MDKNNLSEVFSNIAKRYDFFNKILSFNNDKLWRKNLLDLAHIKNNAKILDLCTGTADIAIEFAKKEDTASIYAVDFSLTMLKKAEEKIKKKGLEKRIHLAAANAFALPFKEGHFDIVSIGFGLRNLIDPSTQTPSMDGGLCGSTGSPSRAKSRDSGLCPLGVKERISELHCHKGLLNMADMLKSGGQVLILEFSPPRNILLGKMYNFYIKYIVPWFAGLLGGSLNAYRYLSSSIETFLYPEEIIRLMELSGLKNIVHKQLRCGVINFYYGEK